MREREGGAKRRKGADLTDYRDTVHLTKSSTLTAMLQDIRGRSVVVTPENLDAFGWSIDDGIADVLPGVGPIGAPPPAH
jgi:hypothetical protein